MGKKPPLHPPLFSHFFLFSSLYSNSLRLSRLTAVQRNAQREYWHFYFPSTVLAPPPSSSFFFFFFLSFFFYFSFHQVAINLHFSPGLWDRFVKHYPRRDAGIWIGSRSERPAKKKKITVYAWRNMVTEGHTVPVRWRNYPPVGLRSADYEF